MEQKKKHLFLDHLSIQFKLSFGTEFYSLSIFSAITAYYGSSQESVSVLRQQLGAN